MLQPILRFFVDYIFQQVLVLFSGKSLDEIEKDFKKLEEDPLD